MGSSVHRRNDCILYERDFSYSFILIFLKLCRCFGHCLKMYMWFRWYRFLGHFLLTCELCHFLASHFYISIHSGCFVSTTPLTVLYGSFWNVVCGFTVWRRARRLKSIIRLHWLITFSFFSTCELFIFQHHSVIFPFVYYKVLCMYLLVGSFPGMGLGRKKKCRLVYNFSFLIRSCLFIQHFYNVYKIQPVHVFSSCKIWSHKKKR